MVCHRHKRIPEDLHAKIIKAVFDQSADADQLHERFSLSKTSIKKIVKEERERRDSK